MTVVAPTLHDNVAPGRRRRPSGDPAPLGRPIYRSGHVYLVVVFATASLWLAAIVFDGVASFFDELDRAVLEWTSNLRRGRGIGAFDRMDDVLASVWMWRVVRWATLVALVVTRRFRHLALYFSLLAGVTAALHAVVPEAAVGALALSMVGSLYTLLPRGGRRNAAKVAAAGVLAVFVACRLYLGRDAPTDVALALVLTTALPVVLFRYVTPHGVFPIRYGRGPRPSQLDSRSSRVITEAVERQLGWRVRRIDALHPPGSSGSTPLLLDLDDGTQLFAKLYSLAHLRADRWYKLGRAVLYGRLEDEAPFADIRHLVEHEDYMLRVARDAGVPVPRSHGIVQVTPGREYVLVTEALPDARQLGDCTGVADQVVVEGLDIVRRLWSAGMAHRDVKPANLVVSAGRLYLVDLSFAELRATPWRQAVDLGNMLLTLSLAAGQQRVLELARSRFSDDEIAEALACTRTVTIPAQLRALMRARSPDLPAHWRQATLGHAPVAIQRWSAARVALTAAVAIGSAALAALLVYNLETAGLL